MIALVVIFAGCSSVKRVISRVPGFPDYKNDKDMAAQAVSNPGFIGKLAGRRLNIKGQTNIACTVDVIDPVPDNKLGHGETITFIVTVRNFSMDRIIHPKLEVSLYLNDNPDILKIIFLNSLDPGEKAEFKEYIEWHRDIAGKLIRYRFRVFDNLTNSSSLVMEEDIPSAK